MKCIRHKRAKIDLEVRLRMAEEIMRKREEFIMNLPFCNTRGEFDGIARYVADKGDL